MSTCLTDTELQAHLDGELPQERRSHADGCTACRERLAERRAALDAFADWHQESALPPDLRGRVMDAFARAGTADGATTLRTAPRLRSWRLQLALAGAAALVVAIVVFGLLPPLGEPTRVTAAEVLGRSVQALGAVSGVERLAYDVRLEGLRTPLLEGTTGQSATIEQVIDYDRQRFFVAKRDEAGTMVAAMAEDGASGTRQMMVRLGGRRFVARLALPPGPRLFLPTLVRSMVGTWLGIVQASGARNLTLATASEGGQYVVTAPDVGPAAGGVLLLRSARIVIDARDYHLVELDTRGAVFDTPYHVSFRLRDRHVDATAPDEDFQIASEPGDIVLDGTASDNPFWDFGSAALSRLAAGR